MESLITLKSPAKINLTLDILGKDEKGGKHFVNTLLYRDDAFFDELEIEAIASERNSIICDHPDVPENESNLVMKALDLLRIQGVEITLKKNIPPFSGLGGGSGNAGVILKYFGEQKNLPEHIIQEMAKELGADVPFFTLDENLAYCEGYGDLIQQSWTVSPLAIAYIKTGAKVSSAEAYGSLDLSVCGGSTSKTDALLKVLNEQQSLPEELESFVHNDFEASFFKNHPKFADEGHLCGSGGMMWKFSEE